MSHTAEAIVLAVLVVATSIWVGGYIAIMVVARVAVRLLDQPVRVAFFRALGRKYFLVGTPSLVVALIAGGVLARDATSGGLYGAIVVISVVLLLCLAVAVRQARRMTRLRLALTATPADERLRLRISSAARTAGLLRGVLGLLSIALVVLGSFLAVG